jgi:hypothetical protein
MLRVYCRDAELFVGNAAAGLDYRQSSTRTQALALALRDAVRTW